MNARALIIKPRLDIPFKDFGQPVPEKENDNSLPPIRRHWANYIKCLQHRHGSNHDLLTLPLYMLDKNVIKEKGKNYDVVYVPHKQKEDFECGDNVVYYMQTVFPYLFSEDKNGWGPSSSWSPVSTNHNDNGFYEEARDRFLANISKFNQPEKDIKIDGEYYLFLCQIPHDETIKYHSDVDVYSALYCTIRMCQYLNKHLVVKGHPVNPTSMSSLRELTLQHNMTWIDDASLLGLMQRADRVITVNSGTGFEAALINKPIICFGETEYANIAHKIKLTGGVENFVCQAQSIQNANSSFEDCRNFINNFKDLCVDTRDVTKS